MIRWFTAFSLSFGTLWSNFYAPSPNPEKPPSQVSTAGESLADDEIKVDFEMDVVLVEFDVSVHDSRGDFVPGLTQDRFQLFEDGEPVEIATFEEIVQKPGLESASGQEPTGRRFLIFVDTYLAGTRKVMQVRRDLVRFLEENMVDGDSLSLAVLDSIGELTVHPGIPRAEIIALAKDIKPIARLSAAPTNSYEQAHKVLEQVEMAVSDVLAAPVPPPRNVIFLSPGFIPAEPEDPFGTDDIGQILDGFAPDGVGPIRGGFDPFRPEETRRYRGRIQKPGQGSRADELPTIESLMSSLAGWLSARNITLYSVNCGEKGPLDLMATGASMADFDYGPRTGEAFDELTKSESEKLNMLRDLAELTGGLAWLNTRSYQRAFHRIDQATAIVYRIGFRPETDRPRGRYHKLKVVVDHEKKVKIRHPRGYLDS